MIKMLNDETNPQTQEKFAFEIRRERKLKQMITEMEEINTKIEEINTKIEEAHEFIKLLLSTDENNMDENLKNKIIHLKKILNISNV